MRIRTVGFALALVAWAASAGWAQSEDEFVYPRRPGDAPIFGVRDGILLGLHPAALDGRRDGGPRGLMRVGHREGDELRLDNYIAVEPVVGGRRGLSELEKAGDGRAGKRFVATAKAEDDPGDFSAPVRGTIAPRNGELRFAVHVEPFANGARPVIEVILRREEPWRVGFRVFAAAGGAPMAECVLTATMGNQSRCRNLWLADRAVSALVEYEGYGGKGFADTPPIPLDRLHRTTRGEVVVAITPDEAEPREVFPIAGGAWHHPGRRMAQFWIKPPGTWDESLRCRVNGRRVYWQSASPLPGGPAFENFELQETWREGLESWFGLCRESPRRAFDFPYDLSPWEEVRREIPPAEKQEIERANAARRPLANGDFSAGLDGWIAEEGAAGFRVFEEAGGKRLTTFGAARDDDTGRLYQCFVVPGDARELRLFLHGGCEPERLRVAFWRGEVLHRRMTARRDNVPFEVCWDARTIRDETVTLEILDRTGGKWGFIGVHGIEWVRE